MESGILFLTYDLLISGEGRKRKAQRSKAAAAQKRSAGPGGPSTTPTTPLPFAAGDDADQGDEEDDDFGGVGRAGAGLKEGCGDRVAARKRAEAEGQHACGPCVEQPRCAPPAEGLVPAPAGRTPRPALAAAAMPPGASLAHIMPCYCLPALGFL